MSGRSGVGQPRGATLGPQPLKATVPYQLASKHRHHRRDGKSAGKTKLHQLSSGMRRTMSLDAIIGPYLQGQWPKEPEGQSSLSVKDKSTQTPDSWSNISPSGRGSSSHKRSASWGSAENLQETQPIPIPHAPLSTLAPRLRCSVEGLNQELEGMFISLPPHPQDKFLEVPDGHRAPVPPLCSSGCQSDASTTMSSSSCSSSSPSSPFTYIFPSNLENSPPDLQQGLINSTEMCLPASTSYQNEAEHSLLPQVSSSPGPNKSFCFQRQPPEGCEKVKASEEMSSSHQLKPALISSCPDPNKVNFTPHGVSAFCPVSLLKPMLPSMDLLLNNPSVSPTGGSSSQGTNPCQATSSSGPAAPDPNDASAITGENCGEGLTL
ncbi:protein FAM117A isoform X2 [Antennarius striatus]|uniref:protein FAM117A isoform X2 n=1 Tax=Antennarius striatus TaxID=241820 RepID=UPI0035AFC883